MEDKKLIIAFDFSNDEMARAQELLKTLDPAVCRIKVGKQMFVDHGPDWVKTIQKNGFDVFLDLKFHDIPTTVAKALQAAERLGVWMVNVHALGGPEMLAHARSAISSDNAPLLIAVTVLTSMDAIQLNALGINVSAQAYGERLAQMAMAAGFEGVVCSAHEASAIKQATTSRFVTVCPGIRLPGAPTDDQSRVLAPKEAVEAGADYLVMGRPITQAPDPMAVVHQVLEHL